MLKLKFLILSLLISNLVVSQNEEVDLGQLFNAIGKLFEKLIAFIGKIFKALFSTVIYALKPIVNHFKVIAIVVMVAAILSPEFVTKSQAVLVVICSQTIFKVGNF